MNIAELIHGLPITLVRGSDATIISDVVEDSRCATQGCLFVARGGGRLNGVEFITEAVSSGAVAVFHSRTAAADAPPPPTASAAQRQLAVIVADDVPGVLGPLAERFHGNPGDRLRLVGVTGTNGKTTIAHLIQQTLTHAGVRAGLIGTVVVDDGRRVRPADLTTPPALQISRLLRSMVANGCTAAVVEASSHGLVQGRVAGLRFHAAVFSNLTGDHLDYHSTRRAYGDAKAMLFASLGPDGWAIVNYKDTKNIHSERKIPVPPEVAAALKAIMPPRFGLRHEDWLRAPVFRQQGTGKAWTKSSYTKGWAAVKEALAAEG